MPKYRTISRWLDKRTGEYVDPPTEVDLDEAIGDRLTRAGCLEQVLEVHNPPRENDPASEKPAQSQRQKRRASSKA